GGTFEGRQHFGRGHGCGLSRSPARLRRGAEIKHVPRTRACHRDVQKPVLVQVSDREAVGSSFCVAKRYTDKGIRTVVEVDDRAGLYKTDDDIRSAIS